MTSDNGMDSIDNLEATVAGMPAAYPYYKRMEPFWGVWRIDKFLGEGTYGKVFRIVRNDFGREYRSALKIITVPPSESEWHSLIKDGMDEVSATSYFYGFVSEIVNEIALMSELRGNSNIVSYEDHMVVEHADHHGWDILIRMELLTPFLETITTENSLDRKQVINIGIDICKALELCHEKKVIHRDIKPENIFVSQAGDYKLGDFGVARTIEKTSGAMSKKGTYTYMAPEVFHEKEYGTSVDLYSLGIVMYKCLNRHRTPFLPLPPSTMKYEDKENALNRRFKGETIPLPIDANDELGQIILKACAYNPEDRYHNAKEMRLELELLNGNRSNVAKEESQDPTWGVFQELPPKNNTKKDKEEKVIVKEIKPKTCDEEEPKKDIITSNETEKNNKNVPVAILLALIGMLLGFGCAYVLLNGKKETSEKSIVAENPQINTVSLITPVTTMASQDENLWDSLFADLKIGDVVEFGSYEQDADIKNGKEAIRWIVLDKRNERLLLLSEKILDYNVYHNEGEDITWEACSLRKWLNDDFYNEAFTEDEQEMIRMEKISNLSSNNFYETSYMKEHWPSWWDGQLVENTDGGKDTEDKVFLLSYEEVLEYFSDQERAADATNSTIKRGLPVMTKEEYEENYKKYYDSYGIGNSIWWLRSPGWSQSTAMRVDFDGRLNAGIVGVDVFGVRPAVWVEK